jgi:hypothetical protein
VRTRARFAPNERRESRCTTARAHGGALAARARRKTGGLDTFRDGRDRLRFERRHRVQQNFVLLLVAEA